jgi:hypothetical protein
MSRTSDALSSALADVHDHYRWQIEAAVHAGRSRLIRELTDAHADEALQLITDWDLSGASPVRSRPMDGVDGSASPRRAQTVARSKSSWSWRRPRASSWQRARTS